MVKVIQNFTVLDKKIKKYTILCQNNLKILVFFIFNYKKPFYKINKYRSAE